MPRALLGFACGVVAASAVWFLASEPMVTLAEEAAGASHLTADHVTTAVRRELGPLVSSLREHVRAHPDAVRYEDSSPDSSEVLVRLEAFEGLLHRLEAQWEKAYVGAASLPEETPRNDAAVEAAVAREQTDRKASHQHHFLWTSQMVYRAYGIPDSSQPVGLGQVIWEYFGPPGGSGIRFFFMGGLVQDVRLAKPRD